MLHAIHKTFSSRTTNQLLFSICRSLTLSHSSCCWLLPDQKCIQNVTIIIILFRLVWFARLKVVYTRVWMRMDDAALQWYDVMWWCIVIHTCDVAAVYFVSFSHTLLSAYLNLIPIAVDFFRIDFSFSSTQLHKIALDMRCLPCLWRDMNLEKY